MIKFIRVPNIEREEYIVYGTNHNGVEGEDICIGYIIKNPIVNMYSLQASRNPYIMYGDNALVSIAKFIKKLNKDLKKKEKIWNKNGSKRGNIEWDMQE